MSRLKGIVEYFFLEDEEVWTEEFAVRIILVQHIMVLIISILLTLQIRKNLEHLKDLNNIVKPIYRVNVALVIRNIIYLVDYLIWVEAEGTRGLNDTYENLIWAYVVYETYKVLANRDLIQIPRLRLKRFASVLQLIRYSILASVFLVLINGFVFPSFIFESITVLAFVAVGLIVLYLFVMEHNGTSSKLIKLRWKLIIYSWTMFLTFMFAFVIGFFIADIYFPDGNINAIYYLFFSTFMTLAPLGVSYFSFATLFLPEWARKKAGIINPKEFLNDS